jgi:hypothetical protein
MAFARLPDAVEQRTILPDVEEGAAELTAVRGFHRAAELGADGLLAVTDAHYGNAHLEHRLGRGRCGLPSGRGGAARKDDRLGPEVPDALVVHGAGQDFAIDARLAHTPRDELGHL